MTRARINSGLREFGERLTGLGLRSTPQRREVYAALLHDLDHPTAQEVFLRVKRRIPEISLATVYNCLETLVGCGLLRRVEVEAAASRFCANRAEHSHFYCERCETLYDVAPNVKAPASPVVLPRGFAVIRFDITVHGLCADCASASGLSA